MSHKNGWQGTRHPKPELSQLANQTKKALDKFKNLWYTQYIIKGRKTHQTRRRILYEESHSDVPRFLSQW